MEARVDRPATEREPVWVPAPPADGPGNGKEERRRRKREEKLRRDAVRATDSWERFRILLEVVDQQRNVVEIADNKARYALIILGVLNAVIFVLLGRGGVFRELPDGVKPWLVGVIAIYAALTFVFV